MNGFLGAPALNTLLLVVISLVVGLGYLRWAKAQGATVTIKLLNEQIGAQNLKIASQDSEIKVLQATLTEQTRHLSLLTDLVKGVPAWERLYTGIERLEAGNERLEMNAKRLDQLIEAYPTDWLHQQMLHIRQTSDLHEHMVDEGENHDAAR